MSLYSALHRQQEKKKLTLLGICAVISIIVGSMVFTGQLSKSNGWEEVEGLEKVVIANRAARGFDIYWKSVSQNTSEQWVEVGTQKNNYSNKAKSEKIGDVFHSVISGLKPQTRYFFRIRNGDKTYKLPRLLSNSLTTPREIQEKPVTPAYGKVLSVNSHAYMDGLLIYEVDGFYPLATFTKQTGEWLIPLTGLVEKKTNTITSLADTAAVTLKLFSYPEGAVRTSVSQTRPLRQVLLAGKRIQLAKSTQSNHESVLGVSSQTIYGKPSIVARIIYPKENAVIPGSAPLIRGTAEPGKDVLVLIQGIKQYSYRTQADDTGDWVVQAPISLEFGRYTITVTIQNGRGATTIVKRNFSIIKSGEQVLGEATGSPTLAPTAPVPTYANPTPTADILPTSIILSPTASPPITGGGISFYLFGALLFIIVGTGLVLAF